MKGDRQKGVQQETAYSAVVVMIGSATPKINVKQSGRLVVVLIVLNGSNTLALTNPRDRCSFSGN